MSNLYSRLCAGVLGGLAGLVIACGSGSNDKQDAGSSDACVSCVKLDSGYLADAFVPDTGCNPNCQTSDAGQPVDAGYVNQVPIVVAYTTDTAGNRKSEFKLGERVLLRVDGTVDPDCDLDSSCESNEGIDYCKWESTGGGRGVVTPGAPAGNRYFSNLGQMTYNIKCFENRTRSKPEEERPYGEGSNSIILVQ